MLRDPIYLTFWKWQNYREEEPSGIWGLERDELVKYIVFRAMKVFSIAL